MDKNTISRICDGFGISSVPREVTKAENGRINTTFFIHTRNSSYVLQRLNTKVFDDTNALMSGIDAVTKYISAHFPSKTTLQFLKAVNGRCLLDDESGTWRCSGYIDGDVYKSTESDGLLYGAGFAFGEFQKMLSGFEAKAYTKQFSDFHNTPMRLRAFISHSERLGALKSEAAYVRSVMDEASVPEIMRADGILPTRTIHNDAKLSNVIFGRGTDIPISVIDLDTVSDGLSAYDFGDLIRSVMCRDYSASILDESRFRMVTRGFIDGAAVLSDKELESLPLGAFAMTVELAVRYLDDYISGGSYFKCGEDALRRGICLLKLSEDILHRMKRLHDIVSECINER